jgi:alpha-galactosidase
VPRIEIRTGEVCLVLEPDAAGRLRQIGWRPGPVERGGFPPEAFPVAYPTWGDEGGRTPALRVSAAGGVGSVRLVFQGHEQSAHAHGEIHRIQLADQLRRLSLVLVYSTWERDGVLEQWVELANSRDAPLTLHELAAASATVAGDEPWLTHYGGDWAGEWTVVEERLRRGAKVLESYGVVRPHLQLSPFFLLSPAGTSDERAGAVLAGALAWGGGVRLHFGVGHPPQQAVRVLAGHRPAGAGYLLEAGETFETPHQYWAWSMRGRAALTHRLHGFVRDHVVRDGRRLRRTVLNNWEATFFDFDLARLATLMEGGRAAGAELFLLDDGWFGDEHPRDGDDAGLGDWTANPRKLPGGLAALAEAATASSLDLGLWIEPEMVNRASRLYAQHPDWVVSEPGRELREERNQLVLDLCRDDVRAFVSATIDKLLTECPGISYLKWDANRDLTEAGSAALGRDRQDNIWVDTVRARSALMAGVAERHPGIELMLCASGGGRTDLDSLRHVHEVWLSDNTDAVARVHMQWHASHFLPAEVIAAHVTRWDGQGVEFACAVAMSARFGFDLDMAALGEAEREVCRRAAEAYAGVRDLVQLGELHRLVSPECGDGARAALMYVDEQGRRAVVFAYQLADTAQPRQGRLLLAGIDRTADYDVRHINLSGDALADGVARRSGAALLEEGLDWPLHLARTAVIWEIAQLPG